jgi:hypothetical protein
LSKISLASDNELHPKNLITFVFNVEVFPHVCSFCHGFGHLLARCPHISTRIEIQPILPATFPLVNLPIALVPNYPNIVLRNSGSHSSIRGDRGEFPRVSNPIGNPFPSPKGYGSFAALTSM